MGQVVNLRERAPFIVALTDSIHAVSAAIESLHGMDLEVLADDAEAVKAVDRMMRATAALRRKAGVKPKFPEYSR